MATYNGHQEDSSGNILLSIGNGMTATLETGSTASQAYTKGAYLFFNNKLCKTSTSITSGTTLAIGTNLTQTTIGAELTSHLIATNGDEFYFDYKDGQAGFYPNASKTASQFVPFGGTAVSGTYSTVTTGTLSVNVGFKPKYLMIWNTGSNKSLNAGLYSEDFSTTKWIRQVGSGSVAEQNLGSTLVGGLYAITNTGFEIYKTNSVQTGYNYVAIS